MTQEETDDLKQYLTNNFEYRGLTEIEYIKINKASERFTTQSIRQRIEIIKKNGKFKNLSDAELFDLARLIMPTCHKVYTKNKVIEYFLNLNKSKQN